MERFYTCQCGAQLDLQTAIDGVIKCPYCAQKVSVPRKETPQEAFVAILQGRISLSACKFEDAKAAFQHAIQFDGTEPEAYFGLALATFKVQYLKDEVNDCWQPICYEISDKTFTDDKNYRKALELATIEQKRVYRAKGQEIDDIRDEFYALEQSGLDYDCFLCVKVSDDDRRDADGNKLPTQDSHRANEIYYHLKDKGYKPFYSEREIKGRTGSAYEALILYALIKSECMMIVCSNESYLSTPWVKNEYSRFMTMVSNNEKERDALTFVFDGNPIEKLPNGKKIQGINLQSRDAFLAITDFVENHTPEAKQKREQAKARAQQEEESRRKQLDEQAKWFAEQQQKFVEQQKKLEAERLKLEELKQKKEQEQKSENKQPKITYPSPQEQLAKEARAKEERKKQQEEKYKQIASHYDSEDYEIKFTQLKKYKGNAKELVIPSGVAIIGDHAFKGCDSICSVVIPDTVKELYFSVFENCTNLVSVTIPDSVTKIWASAFRGCTSLKSITIPNRVNEIFNYAFKGCTSLTDVTLSNRIQKIGYECFLGCSSLVNVSIPNSVTIIAQHAFQGCASLKSITIPNSVTVIGVDAFADCDSLVSVTIPERFKGVLNSNLKNIFGRRFRKIKFTFTK